MRVSEAALTRDRRRAVAAVDGARLRKGRRRLGVELAGGRARAELELAVEYGSVSRGVRARCRSTSPMRSRGCATSRSRRLTSRSRSWIAREHDQPSRGAPRRALHALPVGRHRPAARLAVRGRRRRVHAQLAGAVTEHAAELDARITRPPTTGPRTGSARSSATSCASRSRSSRGRGADGGRPRRGGDACEAVRIRGCCEAGERDPGQARAEGRAT